MTRSGRRRGAGVPRPRLPSCEITLCFHPQQLAPAIQQTIAAACLSGVLLAISLVAWRWFH